MSNLATRIVKYMELKKYKIFSGTKQYNIVYLEGANADGSINLDTPNHFNDRRLVIQLLNNEATIIGNWEATTEPGNHYTVKPMNPGGAARIAFGQYRSWCVGMHGTRDVHESLVQVAEVCVHRDYNKDYKRPGDKLCTGLFGINQHWGYDLPTTNVANSSAGCLVGRSRGGHREFMNLIKKDIRYESDRRFIFTSTIIAADDLVKYFP